MPELPEVETIKNALVKGIGNCQIRQIEIRNFRLRERIPEDLAVKICNSKVVCYKRIAKYIVIELNNGLSLIWHMGMSGKIKISDELPRELDKHDHVVIKTDKGYIIYNDPRRFGVFTYCETDKVDKNHLFRRVGIDPFNEELSAKYLFGCLQKKKRTPIKIALLDQNIIAGIGNIYASEILYESKILPMRLSRDVSLAECEILIKNIRKVLERAIAAGGSTLRDYKKPDGSLGYFQNMHCVYDKIGKKCPRCVCDIEKTGGIKKIVQAGRSTFYCERLQK